MHIAVRTLKEAEVGQINSFSTILAKCGWVCEFSVMVAIWGITWSRVAVWLWCDVLCCVEVAEVGSLVASWSLVIVLHPATSYLEKPGKIKHRINCPKFQCFHNIVYTSNYNLQVLSEILWCWENYELKSVFFYKAIEKSLIKWCIMYKY